MPAANLTCPVCKKSFALAGDEQTSVACPHCKKSFKLRPTNASRSSDRANEPAVATPAAHTGEMFGRFQLRKKLGAGAFGTVYLAHDPQLDRAVALKVPNPGTLTSARRVERFLREARAAANLRHPNIVPLFEAGQTEGNYYIASAFIKGRELAECIPEGGMDLRQAAQVVRALADAVAYAHEQGIIHRDIKPANVILDEKGQPHLMDFGLASRADETEKLTHDGAVMGTPAYMAPESAKGQKGEAKPASDQYALGVLLYELLTGETPWTGPPAAVLAMVLSEEPEAPSKRRKGIPRDLETICLKCLEKDPERRYADCRELSDDLRRWLEDEPIEARRLGPVERLMRWVSRNKVVASLVATTAATLFFGVIIASSLAVVAAGNAAEAGRQAKRADDKAIEAETNAAKALKEAAAARTAEGDARKAEGEARAETLRANRSQYAVLMQQTNRAWEDRQLGDLRRILAKVPAELQSSWEPRYFLSLLDQSVRSLPIQVPTPRHFAFVANGQNLLVLCAGGDVKLLETGTWKILPCAIPRLAPNSLHMAVPLRGKNVAFASENTVTAYDLQTGKVAWTYQDPAGRIATLDASEDGNKFAAGFKGLARVWTGDGALLQTLKATIPEIEFTSLNLSADGKSLLGLQGPARINVNEPGSVQVWDTDTGKEIRQLPGGGSVGLGALRPDGRQAAISGDGLITLADLNSERGAARNIGRARGRSFGWIQYHPKRPVLLTNAPNGNIRWWDAESGTILANYGDYASGAHEVAVSPDQRWMVTQGTPFKLKAWDLAFMETGGSFQIPGGGCVGWSPDGQSFVTDRTTTTGLTLLTRGGQVKTGSGVRQVYSAVFTPDGSEIVIGTLTSVKVLDATTLKEKRTFATQGPVANIMSVVLDPTGRFVVFQKGGPPQVWDQKAAKMLHSLPPEPVTDVTSAFAISPDGRLLATCGSKATIKLMELETGKVVKTFLSGKSNGSIAFSRDGSLLAVGAGAYTESWPISLLNAATGEQVGLLEGHAGAVKTITFTADNRSLVSFAEDGTIRRWDIASRQEILTIPCGFQGYRSSTSPDGESIAVLHDKNVHIWTASPPLQPVPKP